jgi:hypothetical protein
MQIFKDKMKELKLKGLIHVKMVFGVGEIKTRIISYTNHSNAINKPIWKNRYT